MKFSVNWLREFVDLPTNIGEIAELLTLAGVETENIETRGAKMDNVIVAQITASSRHPDADRLSVCEVDDASGTKRQVVCGATNYKVGDKVPLALPGAKLPNGLEIRKSKLRGVESEGMLCSPIELGLGEEASGLLILSPDSKIGAPITDTFPSDTILDVEITPNRGDLLSHYGLAREIAALTGKTAKSPGITEKLAIKKTGIEINAPAECPFYSARKIDGINVGPSPGWLRAKIEAAGIRSINNIVDISNFVMLELGQPTHAFDADKLKGGIIVRLAKAGEKFLALDGKTYSLTPKDLVIADHERVVGIGGVMGGEETGVTDSTRNVLLEAAYFSPASVRCTAHTLNLPSDASYRFERGVDPEMVLLGSNRAASLIAEMKCGNPAKEIAVAGSLPSTPTAVSLRYDKCDRVLGITIRPKSVDQILERFGLSKKTKAEKAGSTWKIPSYRRDLQRDVDLIEEVIRAYGVDKVAGTDCARFAPARREDFAHDRDSELCDRLAGRGLTEVRTSKLISREAITVGENAVELHNPLSEDHVALRPNLLAGLLGVLQRNVRAGAQRVTVFEIGRIFPPPDAKVEEKRLGILVWGEAELLHWRSTAKRRLDFIDLKGAIESICPAPLTFRRGNHRELALAVEILLNDKIIGFAGQLAASRAAELDATGGVLVAELNLDSVVQAQFGSRVFRELERFPAVTRDIAMFVPENISYAEILRTIENPKEQLLEKVELFDFFLAAGDGPARKSLAYRLTFRDKNRTLTNEEVTAAHAKIRERLRNDLGAELRE